MLAAADTACSYQYLSVELMKIEDICVAMINHKIQQTYYITNKATD